MILALKTGVLHPNCFYVFCFFNYSPQLTPNVRAKSGRYKEPKTIIVFARTNEQCIYYNDNSILTSD